MVTLLFILCVLAKLGEFLIFDRLAEHQFHEWNVRMSKEAKAGWRGAGECRQEGLKPQSRGGVKIC